MPFADASTLTLLRLPTEILLMIVKQMAPSALAASVHTSARLRALSIPVYDSLPIEQVLVSFKHVSAADNHQAMALLLPKIRRELRSDPYVGYAALVAACTSSNTRIVRRLAIDDGIPFDVGARCLEPTPLLAAMKNKSTGPLGILVAAGADMRHVVHYSKLLRPRYVPTNSDKAWLHHAAIVGLTGAVKYLFEIGHGCNVDWTDHMDSTPLLLAAERGHLDIVSFLLEKGAQTDHTDLEGRTALFWASKGGHVGIVRVLVAQGADLDKADEYGRTPMLAAVQHGRTEVVQFLLDAGADKRKPDIHGNVPKDYAERSQYREEFAGIFGFPLL
ncbi:ankyrin repeat-containing domain protein [Aspergillus tetrazonus]